MIDKTTATLDVDSGYFADDMDILPSCSPPEKSVLGTLALYTVKKLHNFSPAFSRNIIDRGILAIEIDRLF